MKRTLAVIPVVLFAAAAFTGANRLTEDFSSHHGGTAPSGMLLEPASHATWFVRLDTDGNRVLAQEAAYPSNSIALLRGSQFGDLSISARVRGLSGTRVQGLVWRFQDPSNYYLVRAEGGDAEGKVVPEIRTDLYYKGKRIQLGGKARVPGLNVARWFRLKVEHRGSVIKMFVDDTKVAELNDSYWCTLVRGEGAAGFWTMRGATAQFDDLVVRSLQ